MYSNTNASTNTVAIDIGRTVGVQSGAEFLIFHPDFVGDRAFLKSDGRSTRSLGHYPRVAHGRLIAVHVQEEITFCEIAKSDFSGPIPEGSHLELIPIGTISHLVERRFRLSGDEKLLAAAELPNAVDGGTKGTSADVIAFTLKNFGQLEAVGTFRVNEALAGLYKSIHSFAPEALMAQTSSAQLAVALGPGAHDVVELVDRVLASVRQDVARPRADFCAGAFRGSATPGSAGTSGSHAIEFAPWVFG